MATKFAEPGTDATQDFRFWNTSVGGTGAVTSDTAHPYTGTRSIKALNAASADAAIVYTNDILSDAGARVSSRLYFSTVTPATRTLFMSLHGAGNGSMIIGIGLNTNGTIHMGCRGSVETDGATVLAANTFYRFTISYRITSASNWGAKVYINGVLETSLSNANGNITTGVACASFGTNSSSQNGFTTPAAMTQWIDDVFIDDLTDQTDCGEYRITAKRPFANGTLNNFTTQIGSGGSSYGSGHAPQVNEQPLSTTNGWSMIGAGAAVTEEYTIEGQTVGDVSIGQQIIMDYVGWVYASSLASETGSIVVGGSSSNISLTSTNTLFTKAAGSTVYPAGGTDIGIVTATTLTTVSLYECGIIVIYRPTPVAHLVATKQAVNRASTY